MNILAALAFISISLLLRYTWQQKKPREKRVHEWPPSELKTRPIKKKEFGMEQFDRLFGKSLENDQKVSSTNKPIRTLSMHDFNRAVKSQQELRAKYSPDNRNLIV